MKIYREESLRYFEFWSGAKDRVVNLTWEDFDTIENMLEMLYPDGMNEGEINDLFWFEFDTIAQWLGYDDEEDFDRKRNGEDGDEEDEEED